ncbi:MAG TPA: right-handed parallel beta-helix repeat-containing protein [Anaerolineales bacterium]|nr:right-handed parallel beta-helix repeat-containing protein [Anaerolineales bacterium]
MSKQLKFCIFSVISILSILISAVGMPVEVARAAGTTYYVDNTNLACSNAGSGTLATPFCTITRGAFYAYAGDTVSVLHGTYAETIFPPRSGTDGQPITFQAEPGVTVTGDPAALGSAFAISTKSYIVIDGFNVTATKYKGIYVDSSNHITISNNHVSYSGTTSPTHPYEQGIFLRSTTDSIVTGNTTDHNTCIGIRLTNGSDNNIVSNNVSFANFSVIESDAAGIELLGSSYNTVIHNITYGNEDAGINMYVNVDGVPSSHNLIIGNLSYENGDHGIDNNNSPYNTVVGNTVHANGTVGINFEGEPGSGSHHATVANNISVGNGLTPPTGSFGGNLRVDSASIDGTVLDYDLFDMQGATVQIVWNDTNYASLADFQAAAPGQESHAIEGDPGFITPVASVLRTTGVPFSGVESVGDYHLSAGSPAIDSANSGAPSHPATDIEGNLRVDDPATPNNGAGTSLFDDRGAYEFQPSETYIAPTVTTQAVSAITAFTATGNGTITSLGVPNPTQHGVVWSTSANPTTSDNKTTDGPISATGAFTSAITGLTPGTLYHVRAYATNAAATVYGDDVSFTTLASAAPAVATQAPTNITDITATGNGNLTSLGVPNPTQHGVVWSTTANPTTANNKTEDGPLSATGAFTSNITGLTAGTLYHVRAYATNTVGTAYGVDVIFTTLLVPTVTTQAVTSIADTTATGNGNLTALGVPNPTQHGVVWSTTANPTTANNKTEDGPLSATGAFTSAITGLTPGTLYHVRAYATNAAATVYGDDVSFTTLASAAPTVTTQAATNITDTTATGNGNLTSLGVPNPTQHGVVWSTTANPTTANSKTTDGPLSATGAFTSNMTGLTAGTLYHVRAYATNTVGTVYGTDVTFTTLLPPTVTTQAVTNIAQTSATGNGNITALGMPNPTQHGVVWGTSLNPTIADSKTTDGAVSATGTFTSNLTGLTPGTLYHVRAYATNAAATSYGEDVVFTTIPFVPAAFAKTAPANAATGQPIGATLSWAASVNAASYEYCYDTTNDNACTTWTDNGLATTANPGGLNPSTRYYWQVRANNAAGSTYANGAATAFWSFTTSPLPAAFGKTAPANNALKQPIGPSLTWAASANALTYEYCVDTTNNNTCDASWIPLATRSVRLSGLTNNTPYYWQVRAVGSGGTTSANGGAWWTFKVIMAPPALLTPDQAASVHTRRPSFTWAAVPGASGYTIEASTVATFASKAFSVNVTAPAYTSTLTLLPNKLYYWHVRANGLNGPSAFSAARTFTTGNPPPSPTLVSPATNTLFTNASARLDWNNVVMPATTTFDHYHVQIATNAAFTTGLIEANPTASEFALDLTPNTRYYWRVRAFNAVGDFSGWSASRIVRAAMLVPNSLTPGNVVPGIADPVKTRRLTYTWDQVTGATSYTLQASLVSNFASLAMNINTAKTTYTHTADLAPNKVYYWRVRANGLNGPSAFSAVRTFTTGNPPSTPALSSPANNALLNTPTVLFDWVNATLPAGVAFHHYQIQIATSNTFTPASLVVDANTTATVLGESKYNSAAQLSAGVRYYWRVRSWNTQNDFSAWSAVRIVRIRYATPSLLLPANAATGVSRLPTFDWNDVSGATTYTLQVSTSSTFVTLVVNSALTSSTYTRTTNLLANKLYYWRVRANGPLGSSNWSPVFSFKTTP